MGRGFAQLSPAERKEMASRGGRAAHASGMAHEFDSESAKKAVVKSIEAKRAKKARAARDAGKRVPEDDEAHEGLDQLD